MCPRKSIQSFFFLNEKRTYNPDRVFLSKKMKKKSTKGSFCVDSFPTYGASCEYSVLDLAKVVLRVVQENKKTSSLL
jgi:transposase-like protein